MAELGNTWVFPGGSDGEESARNAGDPRSVPGLGTVPWTIRNLFDFLFFPFPL